MSATLPAASLIGNLSASRTSHGHNRTRALDSGNPKSSFPLNAKPPDVPGRMSTRLNSWWFPGQRAKKEKEKEASAKAVRDNERNEAKKPGSQEEVADPDAENLRNGSAASSTEDVSSVTPLKGSIPISESGLSQKGNDSGASAEISKPRVPLFGSIFSSYQAAQALLSGLADDVQDIEQDLNASEQDIADSAQYVSGIKAQEVSLGQGDAMRRAEEISRSLQLQMKAMEREVEDKDTALRRLLKKTKMEKKRSDEVARKSLLERDNMKRQLDETQETSQQQLEMAMKKEEQLMEQLEEAQEGIAERDAFLKQLQEEAALSASALKEAAKSMASARERTVQIEEQLEMLGNQLAKERDNTRKERERSMGLVTELTEAKMMIGDLKSQVKEVMGESSRKDEMLKESRSSLLRAEEEIQSKSQALSFAQQRIKTLESELETKQGLLEKERSTAAEADRLAQAKDKDLVDARKSVDQLTAMVSTLQAEAERKERTLEAVREETARSAQLLMSAARTKKDLAEAQRRITQLQDQVKFLEEEMEDKDSLLSDVRADAQSSAEALRTAAVIKQELNEAREREAELQDEVERKEEELEELRREVAENLRAEQAEMALQEAERRAQQLEQERETLRTGIVKRDEALWMMKQELERGTSMLSAAADTREALRSMKAEMDTLQSRAQEKGKRLSELESEFVSSFEHTLPRRRTLRRKPRPEAPDL